MAGINIEYRYEDETVMGRMNDVRKDKDECCLIAQNYMSQFPAVTEAYIFMENSFIVIRKTTE